MFNTITDYTYASTLPIVGHNGTLPLTCASGYESTKDFTCLFQDLYTAVYETPYPRCVKSPCRTAPTPHANSVMNCTVPKGDTETCSYECMPGYGVNGSVYAGTVTCNLGTFVWDQPTACTLLPTTVTTTAAPTTEAPSTTAGLTTKEGDKVVEIVKVASSMTITQVFEANATGATLLADTGFVDSIETGIATGLGGSYSKDDVTVTGFTLTPVARRLGAANARRLPEMALKVDYEILVADAAAADVIKATLADPTKNAAFTTAFSEAYTAAEASKGRTVEGLTVVQSVETTVKTETGIIPAPTTTTEAPAAPAPAPKEEEEEDDGSAAVIGGVGGAGVLGGAFYMYKKKSQASE